MDCYSNVQSVSREVDHILILEGLLGMISAIQIATWRAGAYQTVVLVYIIHTHTTKYTSQNYHEVRQVVGVQNVQVEALNVSESEFRYSRRSGMPHSGSQGFRDCVHRGGVLALGNQPQGSRGTSPFGPYWNSLPRSLPFHYRVCMLIKPRLHNFLSLIQ